MGKAKTIVDFLKKLQKDHGGSLSLDTYDSYTKIKSYLEKHIYKNVEMGAALRRDGLLNGHGKQHVDDVINHITKLLHGNFDSLNLYEVYILLMATLLHDIGNIRGRQNHEKNIAATISACEEFSRLDTPIRHNIQQIASAHGGRTDTGDKDTLSTVPRQDQLAGMTIRPRAIASILRFADELADNSSRANMDMENQALIPELNRIYHFYSKCLQPVRIEGTSIAFDYSMSRSLAVNQFSVRNANGRKVKRYLFDEIIARLCKSFYEMEYCVKHGGGLFHFDEITAKINIYSDDANKLLLEIPLRFRSSGYPKLCTSVNDILESPIPDRYSTGSKLARNMAKKSH